VVLSKKGRKRRGGNLSRVKDHFPRANGGSGGGREKGKEGGELEEGSRGGPASKEKTVISL